jgi:hypothetical protein
MHLYLFYCCSSGNLLTYNKVFVFLAGVKRALWSLQAVRQGLHSHYHTKKNVSKKIIQESLEMEFLNGIVS